MSMSAAVLLNTRPDDTETCEMAETITSSAIAMGELVGDLLDLARAGLGGALPLSVAAMDLKHLCNEVTSEKRAAYPQRELRLVAHGEVTGEWDAGRLRQVVSNLLGNAIQHGAQTHPIEIALSAEGSDVQLSVRNHGRPIPPDAQGMIFEPMVRGPSAPDAPADHPRGSVGLGLYIAKVVVTAHGGKIDVTSSAEAGTVFTVRLPRRRPRS